MSFYPGGTCQGTLIGSPQPIATISGFWSATVSTSTLPVSNTPYTVTACYSNDPNFSNSSGSVPGGQMVTKANTTTTVISLANPSGYGQSATFVATISPVLPGAGTPTGTVTFMDGTTTLGSGTLAGPGMWTYTTSALAAGSHTIGAIYSGDGNFASSSGPLTGNPQVVNNAPQAALIITGPASVTYGVGATATTTGGSDNGTVTFSAGTSTGCVMSGGTLSDMTTVSVNNASGTCILTATKAASKYYSAATSVAYTVSLVKATQNALTVTGMPTMAQVYGATFTVGSSGGTGTGAVTFSGSNACSATGTTVTMTSGTGTCSVMATKATDNNYAGATSVAATVGAVEAAVSSVTPVIASLSPALATAGSPEFTLTVTGANFESGAAVQWNGSVRGTTVVSSSQLTAVITAADLASVGTVNVTVVNPAPSGGTSAAFEFAVDGTTSGGTTISVSAQSTTLDVLAGQSTSLPVTFSGTTITTTPITTTCQNLPVGATCSYNSSTQTVAIQTSASTPPGNYPVLVIFTVTQQTAALFHQRVVLASWTGLLGLPVGLLWFGGIRKKVLGFVVIGLLGLGLALALTGCGGSPARTTTQASMAVTLNVH